MIVALHAGLGAVLDEGLDAAWARHRAVGTPPPGRPRRAGLVADRRGGAPAARSSPRRGCPTGVDEAVLRKVAAHRVRDRGRRRARASSPATAWRIGLMGHSARERSVTTLLGALRGAALSSRMGHFGPPGSLERVDNLKVTRSLDRGFRSRRAVGLAAAGLARRIRPTARSSCSARDLRGHGRGHGRGRARRPRPHPPVARRRRSRCSSRRSSRSTSPRTATADRRERVQRAVSTDPAVRTDALIGS